MKSRFVYEDKDEKGRPIIYHGYDCSTFAADSKTTKQGVKLDAENDF